MEEPGPSCRRAEEQAEVYESMSDIDGNILAFVYIMSTVNSLSTSPSARP